MQINNIYFTCNIKCSCPGLKGMGVCIEVGEKRKRLWRMIALKLSGLMNLVYNKAYMYI